MIGVGAKAPDFQLPRFGGGQESLAPLISQSPVLLVFFKISCPTCQFTLPFLERLSPAGPKPFRMLLISQDDARKTENFHTEFGITIPTWLDAGPEYLASNAYQIRSVPSFFLIDQQGIVQVAQTGFDRELLHDWGSQSGIEIFHAGENVPALQYG